jgi:RNA polymerase-interacting CarD/CdnL/TRCF family regulator
MNFKPQDLLSFSTHGLYRVDNIDSLQGGTPANEFYILSKLNSSVGHKTYVAVRSAKKDGLRRVITAKEMEQIKTDWTTTKVIPVDRKLNCVQKVESLTQIINNEGFVGHLKAFTASSIDLKASKKEDKKVKEFNVKIRKALVEELSLINSIAPTDAEIILDKILELNRENFSQI